MQREPELLGQTVVLIGGSAGIGLETARRARAEGAEVILTGRNPERLQQAALEVGAQSTTAFDVNDPVALERFFAGLSDPIHHILITAGGPIYGPLLEMDAAQVSQALSDHVVTALEVARRAAPKMRPDGTPTAHGRHRRPADQSCARHRLRGHRGATAVQNMEFLVGFDVTIPDGTPDSEIKERVSAEAAAGCPAPCRWTVDKRSTATESAT